MSSKQQQRIKSSIVDANNHLNGVFLSFDLLNCKLHSGARLIDIFSSCISLYKANHSSNKSKTAHYNKLDELVFSTSLEPNTVLIILDASIQNNVAISITHIYSFNNSLKKMLHHTINIISTEAELFALRCGINQVIQISGSSCIIVITDILHAVQKIVDLSMHSYQLQSIVISKDLQEFFNNHLDNSIEFWDCPSDKKWHLLELVDKDMKKFNLVPLYPSKTSWDFTKKKECDNIIEEWHTSFKMSNCKGRNFLNLLNNDLSNIKPSYTKGGPWIKQFSFSNLLLCSSYSSHH